MDIVLVEPNTAGNVGAVARVMKNFGFKNLILINPRCNHLERDSLARAMHGKDVLRKAKVKLHYNDYDYKIATTSVVGGDYNIPRSPLSPEELNEKVKNIKAKIALVFGREDKGLTNEEIKECDFVVTVPTDYSYPAMNLSHSVGIILYELSKEKKGVGRNIAPIGKKEKEVLLKAINESIECMEWRTPTMKQTQKTVWKRLIGKAMLTNREGQALLGFFRKLR